VGSRINAATPEWSAHSRLIAFCVTGLSGRTDPQMFFLVFEGVLFGVSGLRDLRHMHSDGHGNISRGAVLRASRLRFLSCARLEFKGFSLILGLGRFCGGICCDAVLLGRTPRHDMAAWTSHAEPTHYPTPGRLLGVSGDSQLRILAF
jgi:hypothetical protein